MERSTGRMMFMPSEYARPEFLVDTSWVQEHLNDANLRIVDCDLPDQFQRAHLPGAVVQQDHYQKRAKSGRVDIYNTEEFSIFAEELGIDDDTLVIAYDNSMGLYAARLWWALNYYGHDSVKIMNGGWRKWLREGKPITAEVAFPIGEFKFTAESNSTLIATKQQILEDYKNPDVVIWDVRSKGEFLGKTTRGNRRPGRIPDAVHLEWMNSVDNDTHVLKSASELRAMFKEHGITPDKKIEAH
jgi:thiosulfate/3-mercaptopyruvate sulfurtransferase